MQFKDDIGRKMYTDLTLAISTVLLAVFTLVLAIFTYFLWSEARKTREYNIELNKPELSVIFQPSKKYINFINISIKNIGKSPVYNLRLEKVKNDFEIPHLGKKLKISELKYLNKINYLRPSQEIEQFFISFHQLDKKPEEMKFSLFFEYSDKPIKGKIYKKGFDFDFSQFLDMSQLGDEPIYKISKSLESIEKELGHLVSGFKKLNVITQTKKEKQAEEKKFVEQATKKGRLKNEV